VTGTYRTEHTRKLEDGCQSIYGENRCEVVDPIGWAERGYVSASFGGVPVLVTPNLAAQISACRETLP
jgi:hypothetical protein